MAEIISLNYGIWHSKHFRFVWFCWNLAGKCYLTLRTSHLSQNTRWLPGVKDQKSTKFDPTNHILAQLLVPAHQIWTQFASCSSDLDKIWHEHTTWAFKQSCERISYLLQNPRWPPAVKSPNRPNLPHKSHFGSAFVPHSSDLDKILHECTSWPYKQVCTRIYQFVQNPRWPPEVKCPKST